MAQPSENKHPKEVAEIVQEMHRQGIGLTKNGVPGDFVNIATGFSFLSAQIDDRDPADPIAKDKIRALLTKKLRTPDQYVDQQYRATEKDERHATFHRAKEIGLINTETYAALTRVTEAWNSKVDAGTSTIEEAKAVAAQIYSIIRERKDN